MDTRNLLVAALEATPADHAETLFGERPAGSQWGRPFTLQDWEELLPRWERFVPPEEVRQDGCLYFQADVGDLFPNMRVRAVAYRMLDTDERAAVKEVEGAHGPELVLDGRAELWGTVGAAGRKQATCIVGPHGDAQVVFTIHPGQPLAPYQGERLPHTAVKAG